MSDQSKRYGEAMQAIVLEINGHLGLKEIADRLGCSFWSVRDWIRGVRIRSAATRAKIMALLERLRHPSRSPEYARMLSLRVVQEVNRRHVAAQIRMAEVRVAKQARRIRTEMRDAAEREERGILFEDVPGMPIDERMVAKDARRIAMLLWVGDGDFDVEAYVVRCVDRFREGRKCLEFSISGQSGDNESGECDSAIPEPALASA